MIRAKLTAICLAVLMPTAGLASTTIDFEGLVGPGFGAGTQLTSQDFSTPEVTITQGAYDGPIGAAGQDVARNVGDGLLRFWDTGFIGLSNVAYVDPDASVGEFVFTSAPLSMTTITSFQMSSFTESTETVDVAIFSVVGTSWTSLWSASGTVLSNNTSPFTFTPGVSSSSPLYLQWRLSGTGSIDNVGIDNITLDFAPAVIPVPASLPLLLGALGLLGVMARRRAA